MRILQWLRLLGQSFSVFKWKDYSASRRRGGGNVKIGFIDFQGLVGRAGNGCIVFRAFHKTGISTACFFACQAAKASGGRWKYTWSGVCAPRLECGRREL
jgi:hypothetical protein